MTIICGCCHSVREKGHFVHGILGELCARCSLVFDPMLDSRPRTIWQRFRPEDSCSFCLNENECPLHQD